MWTIKEKRMGRGKSRVISEADRAMLLSNKYIHAVSRCRVVFTEEGKATVWDGLRSGKSCIKALYEMGFPPTDFVSDMARTLPVRLRKEIPRKGHFSSARVSRADGTGPAQTATEERLREELLLKEQELEFLKKITAKANGAR